MNQQANSDLTEAKEAVVAVLSNGGKKARFMTEITAALRRSNIGKDDLERAIAELASDGSIVVRDNFCADPHLAEVDLGVVALIDKQAGADGYAAALHEIDMAWNKWLGEFLANHRCG